jgi:Resolvase, N terminal domain
MGGERLDTRNPTSKLMLTILAGVATWEREIMLERQREGIAKAKAEGKYKGRPASIDVAEIRRLTATMGLLPRQRGQDLGINAILAECRFILFQTKLSQPRPDVHRRCLRPGDACDRLSWQEARSIQVKKHRWHLVIYGPQSRTRSDRNASGQLLRPALIITIHC